MFKKKKKKEEKPSGFLVNLEDRVLYKELLEDEVKLLEEALRNYSHSIDYYENDRHVLRAALRSINPAEDSAFALSTLKTLKDRDEAYESCINECERTLARLSQARSRLWANFGVDVVKETKVVSK